MGKILHIVPRFSMAGKIADAKAVLLKAADEEFETVIIHGYKDGKIYTKTSARTNAMELLGALEAAKTSVWER